MTWDCSVLRGQLHLSWQGELPGNVASKPGFKLWGGTEAKSGAKVKRIVKRRTLILEHNVVRTGDTHNVVDPGCAKQGEERVHVILVGLSMIGVTDVASHRQAEKFAAEVIFETGP